MVSFVIQTSRGSRTTRQETVLYYLSGISEQGRELLVGGVGRYTMSLLDH